MATLCPKAEKLLKEREITLRPETRKKLAAYDPDSQVRWIQNPKVERMIEKYTNDWLALLRQGRSTQPVPTVITTGVVIQPSPTITNNSDPDSDHPIIGLFGDDDDY